MVSFVLGDKAFRSGESWAFPELLFQISDVTADILLYFAGFNWRYIVTST